MVKSLVEDLDEAYVLLGSLSPNLNPGFEELPPTLFGKGVELSG